MAFIETRFGRQVAILSLAAAAFAAPGIARAQTAPPAAQAAAPAQPQAADATQGNTETVEQRIASLHDALKITPAQEPKWQAVAKAMRENAAAMDKLNAEAQGMDPQKMTAVQSLATYQKFARAHVDGLKNLNDDFRALYSSMPAEQKRTADQVFRTASQ